MKLFNGMDRLARRRGAKKPASRGFKLEGLEERLLLTTSTWTGAASNLWSNANNWSPIGAPTTGSDLVFQSGESNLTNTDDITSVTSYDSMTLSGSGYSIGGTTGVTITSIDSSQSSGSNTISFPIDVSSPTAVTVDTAGATLVLGGVVSGSADLTKDGSGELDLTQANTYTGTIAVQAGTLLVDGNQAGSSVTIVTGSTLGGVGTVGSIMASGGTLSPGDSGPGLLTDTGALTLGPDGSSNNSVFDAQLDAGTTPGTDYTQLQAAGPVSLSGVDLNLTLGSGFVANAGQTYMILDNTGVGTITGTFAGQAEGSIITASGISFSVSYVQGTNSNSVVLTELPGSTTSLIATPTSAVYGQSVSLQATVTGSGTTPTGVVEFFNGMNSLGTKNLSGGVATLDVTSLPVAASNSITAVYEGDTNYGPSTSAAVPVTVTQASTTTSVTFAPSSFYAGQLVTFTATVAPISPGMGTPTGMVQFFNGTNSLGSSTLNGSGVAMLGTTALSAGVNSITATYEGDTNFSTSTSQPLPVTANNPFVVTTTSATGVGSLEGAILNANADTTNPNPDTITFAITTGSAPYTISLPPTGLSAITHPVVLDATSQAGYNGAPVIVLNGGNGGTTGSGLVLSTNSDGSTIKGFDIIDFTTSNTEAIDIESSGNVLLANDIGVGTDGSTPGPNALGIYINNSGNTIGSTASGGANVIAGNTGAAIDLNSGGGNAIRQNSIFGNGSGITGSGNGGQLAPALQTVTITPSQTLISGQLTNTTTDLSYTIEFFSSGSSTPGANQAQLFLGNLTVPGDNGTVPFNATLPLTLPSGQTVVATVTPTNNNTSPFSNALAVYTGFVVTTTADNATTPVAGSLRQVINNVNANPPAGGTTDAITFSIASGPQTITLAGALPTITVPVTIDGTTQPGYTNTPIIEISGNGLTGDGLTLGSASVGSIINALEIVDFSGDGINIQSNNDVIKGDYIGTTFSGTSFVAGPGNLTGILINGSNNTIGGTASGSGNVIAFNSVQAVNVASGSGNAIRQNVIFDSGSTPILVASGPAIPTNLAFTSVPNLTTIQGQITGTLGTTDTLEFFASDTTGDSPAFQFLGTKTVTLSASPQSFTVTFNLANALTSGQTVTATATAPDNSTSQFAMSANFSDPYLVTTGTDGVIGSLRQAILDANVTSGTTTIDFDFASAPYAINLTSALPAIAVPVVIDGTSQPGYSPSTGVIVSINGTGAGSASGLTLAAGSGGSDIQGLDIVDFSEAGVTVQSAGNTIGGTAAGAGNVIGSNATGVQITSASATSNLVTGNFIGTDSANDNLGNAAAIQIFNASNNTIGGAAAGASNTIGFNTSNGIAVFSGTGIRSAKTPTPGAMGL